MIRIDRGPEPEALVAQRAKRLPRACAAFDVHGPGSRQLTDTLTDYNAGKKRLYRRQHRKCAYCERRVGLAGEPLEHFRPRAEAWRHVPGTTRVVDHARYWWLCWTWENHLFSCVTCNSRARKSNFFPLAPGTAPLPTPPRPCRGEIPRESFDLSRESPLLLDPSDPGIDPIEHLVWGPVDRRLPRRLWTWELCTSTAQGAATKRIVGLDALIDDVNDRYVETVWPRFSSEVDAPATFGNGEHAREAWAVLGSRLASPKAALAAATWWQLEALRVSTPQLAALELRPAPRP